MCFWVRMWARCWFELEALVVPAGAEDVLVAAVVVVEPGVR